MFLNSSPSILPLALLNASNYRLFQKWKFQYMHNSFTTVYEENNNGQPIAEHNLISFLAFHLSGATGE